VDLIHTFSEHIAGTDYDDLSEPVVEATKKLIIDSLAVGLAGSGELGVRPLVDLLREHGGKMESTVWLYGLKIPAIHAAQVNAVMIHALDYDDTHDQALLHTGAVTVPVAFAVAERQGGVTGRDLITAVALGADLAARLCLANTVSVFERGWHYTTLHGNFSAAAVGGKLLKQPPEDMVSAFGLAYHQACGNLQGLNDGVLAKRMGPGFSCRNGTAAVLMAQQGISGARNVLQGRNGLFNVYHRGDYHPEVLMSELGRRFEVTNLSYKPYPCCRENHPSIDAALALKKEHCLQANEIEEVVANLSKATKELLCEPLDAKRNPLSTVDAQFSIPWTVSSALVKGRVGIDNFTKTAICDGSVLDVANRVTPRVDPKLERMGVAPARLEIRMKDGREMVRQVEYAFGSPENPMDMHATIAKFTDCAAHAVKPFSEEQLQKLLGMLLHMEDVEDVDSITRLLSS